MEELNKNQVDQDICEITCIDEKIVKEVKQNMLEDELVCDLSDLFKVFGDSTRIKLLFALAQAEMCVCDLANVLNMTQSAVSHQLRILRQSKLVKNRKEGKIVYYTLDDSHVGEIFKQGLEHIQHR